LVPGLLRLNLIGVVALLVITIVLGTVFLGTVFLGTVVLGCLLPLEFFACLVRP
jgi:hypothetical protein